MGEANDFMLKADRDLLAVRFEKKRLEWETTRRRGFAKYAFLRCILAVIPCGIWAAILSYFHSARPTRVQLLSLLVFVASISILNAVFSWYRSEKRYRRT
jgi:hypothetical protein